MVGSGFLDGIDNGESSDIFMETILDFPMESVEGDDDGLHEGNWDAKFQVLGPVPSESFLTSSLNVIHNPRLPSHNRSEQKQSSSAAEDAFGGSITAQYDFSDGLVAGNFQAPSPVSVLESSSSCSVEKTLTISSGFPVPVRARTKRSRPSTFNPWLMMTPPISSTFKIRRHVAASTALLQHDNSPPKKTERHVKKKAKEKMKLSQAASTDETEDNSSRRPVAIKRCAHCEVTKTPQWREGPMGPKTLCNACGVRYRSGRLFPEYRPVASPTFVPSLHSNSHKKVIEMRNKAIQMRVETAHVNSRIKVVEMRNKAIQREAAIADTESKIPISPPRKATGEADKKELPKSPPLEFIPMSGYLFDCVLGK